QWATESTGHFGASLTIGNFVPGVDQENGWMEIQALDGSPIWRSSTLFSGQVLRPDHMLSAPMGRLRLSYQNDGDLVLRDGSGEFLWRSGTSGRSAGRVLMHDDGNLKIHDAGDN